jgi:nicotinate-nucleotide--dimethylbenzimidazole phosphoribosyltransferase
MPHEQSPFADLATLLDQLPVGDSDKAKSVADEISNKPATGAIGVSGLLEWLALWQEAEVPTIAETHICVLASSYKDITDVASVTNYIERASKGRAPVNHMCVKNGIGLRVLELAPDMPHDVANDWSERDCMGAIAFGMEATASGGDMLGLSDLAPGNDGQALKIINACIELAGADEDADVRAFFELLRVHAGREIAACIGAMIAARSRRLPVLVEGWGALAAYILLRAVNQDHVSHVRVASVGSDKQRDILTSIGVTPIVGEMVGTGPGCGIAIATSVIAGAITLLQVPDV